MWAFGAHDGGSNPPGTIHLRFGVHIFARSQAENIPDALDRLEGAVVSAGDSE